MGNGGNPRNATPRARAVTKLAVGAVSVVAVLFAVAAITAIALNDSGTHATATPPNPAAGGTPQQTPGTATPGTPPGEGSTWDVTAEDTLAGKAMVEWKMGSGSDRCRHCGGSRRNHATPSRCAPRSPMRTRLPTRAFPGSGSVLLQHHSSIQDCPRERSGDGSLGHPT
jgi:hypothetical protein